MTVTAAIDYGLLMPPNSPAIQLTQVGDAMLLDIRHPDCAPPTARATLNRWAAAQVRDALTTFLNGTKPKRAKMREHLTDNEVAALRKAVSWYVATMQSLGFAENPTVTQAQIAVGIITEREQG